MWISLRNPLSPSTCHVWRLHNFRTELKSRDAFSTKFAGLLVVIVGPGHFVCGRPLCHFPSGACVRVFVCVWLCARCISANVRVGRVCRLGQALRFPDASRKAITSSGGWPVAPLCPPTWTTAYYCSLEQVLVVRTLRRGGIRGQQSLLMPRACTELWHSEVMIFTLHKGCSRSLLWRDVVSHESGYVSASREAEQQDASYP